MEIDDNAQKSTPERRQRKEGGVDLASIEDCRDAAIQGFRKYIKKSK